MEFNLDLMLFRGLYVFITFVTVIVTIAFFFQRYRWRRRKRKGKSNWGFYPSSASMGNALQELSVIAQPQVEHALEEKLNEDAEDDGDSGPENPAAHLHRQAATIKEGAKARPAYRKAQAVVMRQPSGALHKGTFMQAESC